MKRTQERWNNPHPHPTDRFGVSGLKEFDAHESRVKYFQNEQRKWLDQQIREKKMQQQREKQEEELYAKQTMEINRMRGMLEDEFAQRKRDINIAKTQYNQGLAREKCDKEEANKNDRLNYEQNEVRTLQERGVKRPYV